MVGRFASALVVGLALAGGGCRCERERGGAESPARAGGDADHDYDHDHDHDHDYDYDHDHDHDHGHDHDQDQVRGRWTEGLRLSHASHPTKGAATVVVHGPEGFSADSSAPLQVVVFLHGWSGCAVVLEGSGTTACREGSEAERGWGLGERHDEAGTNTLFVVPQLAYLARDGDAGRFNERGFFRQFLDELLSSEAVAARLGGARSTDDVDHIVLVAHSAGFETALAILRNGGADGEIRAVLLMDALYAAPALFAQWVAEERPEGSAPRKILSLHTGRGRTRRFSHSLGDSLRAALGPAQVVVDPDDLGEAWREHRVVIARTRAPHGQVPARHMAEVLRASGLGMRVGR